MSGGKSGATASQSDKKQGQDATAPKAQFDISTSAVEAAMNTLAKEAKSKKGGKKNKAPKDAADAADATDATDTIAAVETTTDAPTEPMVTEEDVAPTAEDNANAAEVAAEVATEAAAVPELVSEAIEATSAVADQEPEAAAAEKPKKGKKNAKNDRQERERLEREQAEKDAATIAAAASAAQALSAVAAAPRLPLSGDIDPELVGDGENAEAAAAAAAAAAVAAAATASDATEGTPAAVAAGEEAIGAATAESAPEGVPVEGAPVEGAPVEGAPAEADAATAEGTAGKKGKGKRGRPSKAAGGKTAKTELGEDGQPKKKARTSRKDKTEAIEQLRGLSSRELLVDRVYSSDTLKRLEREIGLKYKKGRFSAQEDEILKNGIEEFKKRKRLSDDDFQELLYNYKEKGWERDFTELWKDLTGRLEDRANISVRLHIKTRHSQFRNKGKYTAAEDHEIRYRLGELKEDIGSVAKRLGRLGQDISSRWVKLQVRDEIADGPEFTPEEDEAVMEALEKFKREHPNELISWKDVAKDLGNKRSYKVYSACMHSIASRVRRRKAQKDTQDAAQGSQRGGRLKREQPDSDGWTPSDDDLILLQRMSYQQVVSEAQVNWEHISFPKWEWPVDTLKQKFEEIKAKNLPESWKGNLGATLEKLVKTYRAREAKKQEIDDDEDAQALDQALGADATAVESPQTPALGDMPPSALDPAIAAESQPATDVVAAVSAADATDAATVAAPAPAPTAEAEVSAADTTDAMVTEELPATVPADQQVIDESLS